MSNVFNLSYAIGMAWQYWNNNSPFILDCAPPIDNVEVPVVPRHQPRPDNTIPKWDGPRLNDLPNQAEVLTPCDVEQHNDDRKDNDMALTNSHGDKIHYTKLCQ
jgi:hypothetical protein